MGGTKRGNTAGDRGISSRHGSSFPGAWEMLSCDSIRETLMESPRTRYGNSRNGVIRSREISPCRDQGPQLPWTIYDHTNTGG